MDEKLWQMCIDFHGHSCPGLATGYRMTEVCMDFLGIPLERAKDEELVCIAENEACGVDAVQALVSCTPGKGNMLFRHKGKMAFTFFDRRTGKSVRIVTRPYDRGDDRQVLIDRLLNSPWEEFFVLKTAKEGLPVKAKLFDNVVCDECGEPCREDKIRLQNGRKLCLDCFEPYDRG